MMEAGEAGTENFHKRGYQALVILADIVILAAAFLIMVWIKPGTKRYYIPTHLSFFITLSVIWMFISIISGKLHRGKVINIRTLVFRTLLSNTLSISIAMMLLFMFQKFGYSRMVVLGTAGVASLIEIIVGIGYLAVKKATQQDYIPLRDYEAVKGLTEEQMVGSTGTEGVQRDVLRQITPGLRESLSIEWGEEITNGILNIAGHKLNGHSRVLSTTTAFNIRSLPDPEYSYIINLHKINDIVDLDGFLECANKKIKPEGYFLCCAEALGRLCRAGFSISAESFIGDSLFIEARKTGEPVNGGNRYYGLLITLPRIGRGGEEILVYKMRTMHPYSEYIQDYIYNLYELREGGKFRNDFRITTWGAVCRKIWLDELPMLINVFRGEMKIVGVRPLSRQYFNLYSEELRERRIKVKPGLVPPYYYDMPSDLGQIQASEMRYLNAWEKHHLRTDIRYFIVSLWNILFRHARSN
ncbi:MAG: sugar transferase [Bacteroidales bacterium]|nr:sugar transferase [Bacteroidales bacterium]